MSSATLLAAFVLATDHRALGEDALRLQSSHSGLGALNSQADGRHPFEGEAAGFSAPAAAIERKMLQASAALPLAFETNQGQTARRVQYLSRGASFTVFLTADEAVLKLKEPAARGLNSQGSGESRSSRAEAVLSPSSRGTATLSHQTVDSILRMQLIGASHEAVAKGTDELPVKTNYFRGRDPQKWHTNLANYARVRYENIYPSVDLLYYGNREQLEYDFEVLPGGDSNVIRLKFPGGHQLHVDKATGDLLVRVGRSEVRLHRPSVYQTDDQGSKRYLAARYLIGGGRHLVGFRVAPYDHRRTLVIDPTLSYSTYLGGSQDDEGNAIAVDSSGNVYVAGFADSVDFPVTSGAFQTACGGSCSGSTYDAFVTKLNPSGAGLIYSTYLGGSETDQGEGLAIDAAGEAYVTGITYSSDFPITPGVFQKACAGKDCSYGEGFVTELNSTGSALIYSTYLGGSAFTQPNAVAVDSSNYAYVTGWTKSTSFPVTAGVFQPACASCTKASASGFVTEINPSGSALVYSTYLGGSSNQEAYGITLDAASEAYVVGYTESTDFPTTPGAFQTSIAAPEAGFVAKLNRTASALAYSTYLGGSGTGTNPCAACATSVAVDIEGEAYVSGLTWETDFPVTSGAFQTTFAGGFHDAFLTKLNSTGSALIYSTYVGGKSDDGAVAIAIDSVGQLYVRGNTYSPNFPVTSDAFQSVNHGGSDAFFLILNQLGSGLIYSTYLGGSHDEFGHATQSLVLDSQNPPNAYMTGFTSSTNFPVTSGAFQTVFGGVYDSFVSQFAPSPNVSLSPSTLSFGNQAVGTSSPPQTVTLSNTGTTTLNISSSGFTGPDAADFSQTSNCGSSVPAQTSCSIQVTFSPTATGTRTATLSIADNAPGSPQTISLTGAGTFAGPVVSLSPAALTFPVQLEGTTSKAQTVTLTNTGSGSLTITSVTPSTNFGETNTCGSSLAAGATCTISVTFTPGATGTLTGTLSVSDNALGSPQTVSLTGAGTVIKLSPRSLDFGSVSVGTTSSPMTVTVANGSKSSPVSITLIDITGIDPTDFAETNTCGSSLGAQKKCTISVTFTPTVTGGRSAAVSISDNGGGSPQTVALSGTGSQ